MAATADADAAEAAPSRLRAILQNAVVMGDSHGYDARAAQILDGSLERDRDTASATDLIEALAYRAELALRLDDPAAAANALARIREIPLSEAERGELADTLASLDDLAAVTPCQQGAPSLAAPDGYSRYAHRERPSSSGRAGPQPATGAVLNAGRDRPGPAA